MRALPILLAPFLATQLVAQARQQGDQRLRIAIALEARGSDAQRTQDAIRAALGRVPGSEMVSGTNASILVRGTVRGSGDQLVIEATASSPDGKILNRLPIERGSGAADRIADRLAGMAAFYIGKSANQTPLLYSIPALATYQIQQRAESLFNIGRASEALPLIVQAIQGDSSYIALNFLAVAIHGNAGRAAQRDSLLNFLEARKDQLTEIERLNLAWFREPPAKAFIAARTASQMDPASDIWVYAVGLRANGAGYFQDAAKTLSRRAEFAARGSHSAQVWSPWRGQYMEALHATRDFSRELGEVKLARSELPNANENTFVLQEMRALAGLGRVEELRGVVSRLMARRADSVPVVQIQQIGLELKRHGKKQDGDKLIADAAGFAAANEASLDSLSVATALALGRRYDEALPRLERLTAASNATAVRIGRYGVFATFAGKQDVADQMMARIVSLGETPGSYLWRGLLAAAAGKCDVAVAHFRTAVEKGILFGGSTFWHWDPSTEPIWGCDAFEKLVPMSAP